jgi:hypothetical protein
MVTFADADIALLHYELGKDWCVGLLMPLLSHRSLLVAAVISELYVNGSQGRCYLKACKFG